MRASRLDWSAAVWRPQQKVAEVILNRCKFIDRMGAPFRTSHVVQFARVASAAGSIQPASLAVRHPRVRL